MFPRRWSRRSPPTTRTSRWQGVWSHSPRRASGASATISGSPAVIAADGTASVTAASNFIAGSYTVSATASDSWRGLVHPYELSAGVDRGLPRQPGPGLGCRGAVQRHGHLRRGLDCGHDQSRDLGVGDAVGGHDQRHRSGLGLGPGDKRDHRITGGRYEPGRDLDRDCPQVRRQHHRRRLWFL